MTKTRDRGAVAFRMQGNSGELDQDGIRVTAKRTSAGHIAITVSGLFNRRFFYRCARTKKLGRPHIAISWRDRRVTIYLDGEVVSEQHAPVQPQPSEDKNDL